MLKLKPTQKIAFSAMLLILTIIGTRLPALFSIPSFEFVRLSLGSAFIIFSSIFLGPLYGLLIGALSDILGVVLFPTTLGTIGTINPLITLMYALLGVLAWLVYFLISKIKTSLPFVISMFTITFGMLVFLIVFLSTNNSITSFGGTVYQLNTAVKIIIIIVSVILTGFFVASYFYLNKYFDKKFAQYNLNINFRKIIFTCFICEIFIALLMGSLIKSLMFGVDFIVIFFIQSVMFFIDVIVNTYFVCILVITLASISKSYFKRNI